MPGGAEPHKEGVLMVLPVSCCSQTLTFIPIIGGAARSMVMKNIDACAVPKTGVSR